MNKFVLTVILIALGYIIYMFFFPDKIINTKENKNTNIITVNIGNKNIKAEVAKTTYQKTKGLMFRKELKKDTGMLFVFNTEAKHTFWMANTYIPLDIVWINKDKNIVHMSEDTHPCDSSENKNMAIKTIQNIKNSCTLYTPKEKALYVLEINAGWIKENGIKLGDKITFNLD
jgi:uncharacterized membrane protein (UPF0127 family)